MLDSAVTGWRVRNIVDNRHGQQFDQSRLLTLLFAMVGLIPFWGKFIRKIWGREDWRKHYKGILTSWGYFKRTLRAKIAEKTIEWHRAGRVDDKKAINVGKSLFLFLCFLPFSFFPAGLHRILTDWQYAKDKLVHLLVRPIRLYFNTGLREEWLRDMVAEGQQKYILSREDADIILSQIDEPFIQKYLKSLAVHVCTLPVTQVVAVIVVVIYYFMHPELSWGEAAASAGVILIAFQVTPISPGSLTRGLYVLYLVIRERNFKDYNIAVFLGFFKYIGYLAFPIQMAYRYPVLARFMAAYWANGSVHIVPVFGESGALLEHWVYCLFYNWPLTIRRRVKKRTELRSSLKPRFWHIGLSAIAAAALFGMADYLFLKSIGHLPGLKEIWWLSAPLPLVLGGLVTLGCGGAQMWKRFGSAAVCGIVTGVLYAAVSLIMMSHQSDSVVVGGIAADCIWRMFVFAIFSTIGAILTELKLADPDL
jgi:hypothetical protein